MKPTTRRPLAALATLALAAGALTVAAPAVATPASPAPAAPLANLDHLDWLMDTASPGEVPGHTTYRLAEEPELTLPWTYADARDGGTFERIGGGQRDPETGDWTQGAYNADDVSRAAVVYLRHWQQTGADSSRDAAYELLRALAYFQTVEGPDAGNVVLWMQPSGELNPSAEPVELPDPSDSAESYWLARTIWAYGEGYAAFAGGSAEDARFAAFLRERLDLAVEAVDRQVLDEYGTWERSDGVKVPAWLIVDGADASAEAVLGLAAYVDAAPRRASADARDALRKLSEGIAAMSVGDERAWPYGAIRPWTRSTSMWHAWSSQMPAALAAASEVLGDRRLLAPAAREASSFGPLLLASGGPDNAWYPSPIERVQIAYGADSRLQSWLAVADARRSAGLEQLAAIEAAWYFGANRAGEAMYVPETGVTFDGLQADGSINRNSGAESTIHGLLSMIALDAHPEVAARAQAVATERVRDGLQVVEAEDATGDGEAVVPESSWTGESGYSGGAYRDLARGDRARFALEPSTQPRWIEPILWLEPGRTAGALWTDGRGLRGTLGATAARGPAQGVSEVPGVLRPELLTRPLAAGREVVEVRALTALRVDALLVRPLVARAELGGEGATQLLASSARTTQRVEVGWRGERATVLVVKADGSTRSERGIRGETRIELRPGEFAIVTR
ncbi:hypothetical protein [Homoserinibacter sp. YIM 151385]|uniref:hypothetical protein n=1 Tax=Homoserinibacter sp. YIM 151385 TaxID=2985506 RepID=UPI0022F01443|nr:hypothetical protein [Homoserinibacter sp. YIM 151385]WBU37336.1 hypothetical protein OF852_10475 [Homoserinibacter sp. YIM 151385]